MKKTGRCQPCIRNDGQKKGTQKKATDGPREKVSFFYRLSTYNNCTHCFSVIKNNPYFAIFGTLHENSLFPLASISINNFRKIK